MSAAYVGKGLGALLGEDVAKALGRGLLVVQLLVLPKSLTNPSALYFYGI